MTHIPHHAQPEQDIPNDDSLIRTIPPISFSWLSKRRAGHGRQGDPGCAEAKTLPEVRPETPSPTVAKFHLSGARLRVNPKRGKDMLITAGEVTDFAGVVKLKGFTCETAIVEDCHIVFDGSLPKGSVVIEPLEETP